MEKEKIIKALRLCATSGATCKNCPYRNNEKCARSMKNDAADLLEKEEQKWTRCSARLPNDEEPYYVLCQDKYGEFLIAHPYKDEESNTGFSAEIDDYFMIDCVAWSIPVPYKEDK